VRIWLLIVPFALLALALALKEPKKEHSTQTQTQNATFKLSGDPKSVEFFEEYVYDVIKYGSKDLGFPTQMEGGYVSDEEARKIAAYLATLQGYKPTHPEWVQEGAALFYGNCTGCHQKGVKSFPDLERRPLLGIQKYQNRIK